MYISVCCVKTIAQHDWRKLTAGLHVMSLCIIACNVDTYTRKKQCKSSHNRESATVLWKDLSLVLTRDRPIGVVYTPKTQVVILVAVSPTMLVKSLHPISEATGHTVVCGRGATF